MGNQASQQDQKSLHDSQQTPYEYKKLNGIMVRVDKTPSFLGHPHKKSTIQSENLLHRNSHKSCGPTGQLKSGLDKKQLPKEESEPRKPTHKIQVIHEETFSNQHLSSCTPLYTTEVLIGQRKFVRVYVDKDIEFNVQISNDQLTCGWLLAEVTRRYLEELNRIRKEREMQQASGTQQLSPSHKYMRKMIVALKTTDQRESLDYWLTQYDRQELEHLNLYRPLEVIDDGDFLIAHFAKLANQKKEICKKDFEQIKVIGRGGFSRVILVRKKDTGRLYAMKIMKKNKIIREKKLKPILSERKVLERMNHPFIIKLHWAFQSDVELFFVMDLCTGGEIFFHLNKHKKFSEAQAKFYFSEIVLGIEYLHNKNVVYRDIKPENILVDVDGHIRIADFGLSKIIPQRQKSYSFCGSPEYMSPEMLQGAGHDRKVDIYCLGALLFEMLTGLPPFYNKDTNKMYECILNQEMSFPDYMSPQIANMISAMMQKDPTKRYQTITEVKRHQWLKDVQWEDILHKRVVPPIVPSVRDCHIDPDYIELPLDFEESQYKVRLSTERRYSYYYESTLQSKSVTEQSFYNQFFEKNESGSGVVNLLGNGQSSSIKSGVHPYGASMQSEQSQVSQESQQQNMTGRQNKNVITGLENFTFIDVPLEEVEVLRQLKKQQKHNDDKKQNEHGNLNKPFTIKNLNQVSPSSDKHAKLFNQKCLHNNHSILDHKTRIQDDEIRYQNTFAYPQEESNRGNFTLSNKSGVTFEESNQSIAQEFRINESIATVFGPNGNVIGSNIITSTGSILNFRQGSILLTSNNNRLTIQEEDDDDLQSIGGGTQDGDGTFHRQANTQREKIDNFSFKQNECLSPQKMLHDTNSQQSPLLNKDESLNSYTLNTQKYHVSGLGGIGQTMTTATQSSQYHGQPNFQVTTDNTNSQYTANFEETPFAKKGAHTTQNSKNNFQIPQFGRSGSQTNNMVKQPLQNPLFVHTHSMQQTVSGVQYQHLDPIQLEKDLEDTRAHMVLTPTYNKKKGKQDRKASNGGGSIAKKSTSNVKSDNSQKRSVQQKGTVKADIKNNVDERQSEDQEISFSRIPSISGQKWPIAVSGRESINQKQQEVQQNQLLSISKGLHKHKPSYSLSPSNLIAAQQTYQQQQLQQQLQLHQNMKQSMTMKKPLTTSAAKPQTTLNKHLALAKKANTMNLANSNSGAKTLVTKHTPIQNFPEPQMSFKTPEGLQSQIDNSHEGSQIRSGNQVFNSKKNSQSSRSQKFRSMDMTQNILKKSMGAKGATLKNNVAWKQHMLHIQTSQSPNKDATGMNGYQNGSQITASYATVKIENQDPMKLSHIHHDVIFQVSPQNLNHSHLKNHKSTVKPYIQEKFEASLVANKTPDRRDSDLSMDSKSTVTISRNFQQPQADKKRRSDGSQQSVSSMQQHLLTGGKDSTTPSQQSLQHQSKINMFQTPKGNKVPTTAAVSVITPTNQGYNSQRVPGKVAKPGVGSHLKTISGLSRNDAQKKSNTATSKKLKNI